VAISNPHKRLLDTYDDLIGNPDEVDVQFLHTVLAQCGLPYRSLGAAVDVYERKVGFASMVVQSGHLMDPSNGNMVRQGIPYGPKPRLLLIHLCSEAVKRQSPQVFIGDSMSAFMKDLGLPVTGRTISTFKEQMNRLVASHITLGMFYPGGGATTLPSMNPISKFDVWFPSDPEQKVLWESEITLNGEFYKSLLNHAVPMDMRAVQSLQHNARALDVYMWLTYRLPQLRRDTKITWGGLQSQFGLEGGDVKSFKRAFKTSMRQALLVYPDAKVESVDGGIVIKHSEPAVAKKTSVQITKAFKRKRI
jgi:hypothetical protein